MKDKHYQFTLVLKNVDESTPGLEDNLYEAGCDDTLINYKNGTVYLDFDREASSLESAVMNAIKQVESAPIGAIVTNIAPEDLVTESEVSKRLHIKRQAVSLWIKGLRRKSSPFPKPVMKLTERSPLWRWREIIQWLYQNSILDDKEQVNNAQFIDDMNAVLAERDSKIRKSRSTLFKKLTGNN